MHAPLVSCLMVTRKRARLARRAIQSFFAQTWTNRELVIVDDGDDDYSGTIAAFEGGSAIRYHRISPLPSRRLGGLRNLSLDLAAGDYCAQWDDDDWYHPRRIEVQMAALGAAGASVLRYTLMHLETPEHSEHPYRTGLRHGTPGSLLHRRTDLRYPNTARGEDSEFLSRLRKLTSVRILGEEHAYLFIRCFHGDNTWDRHHFLGRLHYTMRNKLDYIYARFVRGDLFTHPAFRLTEQERNSVASFLELSRALDLHITPHA